MTLAPRRESAGLDVFAVGDDAVIVWGDAQGSSVATAQGLAQAPEPTAATPAPAHPLELDATVIGSDGTFSLAQPGARVLLFGMDGQALWVVPIAKDEAQPSMRRLAPARVADRRPGVAFAKQLGVTGVCYAIGSGPAGGSGDRRDGVSFVLVDAQGAPASEPLVIADQLSNIGGCDVAWSGDAFLVIWWQIEMGPDPKPGSEMRAVILRP
jgi:hypothetical protein